MFARMPYDPTALPAAKLYIPFDNTYAGLPPRFFARLDPTPVSAPRLIRVNRGLAEQLGIDPEALATPEGVQVLAGNVVPAGADPIALAYAGHQFGNFSPQLGDGRAILLGEVVARDGARYDLQLKGSGPTPFSRRGDGRAAVGPVLREFLIGEAMAGFGIPTSRALAAVATGDRVQRETVLPGAVLTRVAASHIRVGTFQFFAAQGDLDAVRTLADYTIARHYPELQGEAAPYAAFLEAAVARQAALVARWLLVGFIHGVMNTDNTAVSGETIDYGPCAFMDAYDPSTVFSSIDYAGRYAYGNQPRIAAWNMTRLAEALLPLLGPDQDAAVALAEGILGGFGRRFEDVYYSGLRRKIGLLTDREGDDALTQDLLKRMAANKADFTLTFRALCAAAASPAGDEAVRMLFTEGAAYDEWTAAWRSRLAQDGEPGVDSAAVRAAAMRAVNPAYIPRNHQVEAALAAAVTMGDYGPFEVLLDVVARPFEERPGLERFALPPEPDQRVLQTFCGT
jgi:uncharacterized protein YdiU (UPF0061 family)